MLLPPSLVWNGLPHPPALSPPAPAILTGRASTVPTHSAYCSSGREAQPGNPSGAYGEYPPPSGARYASGADDDPSGPASSSGRGSYDDAGQVCAAHTAGRKGQRLAENAASCAPQKRCTPQ